MATEVKRRRGTTIEHSTFTGAVAELTVDLTKDTVVVHDGATQGGFPLLREDFSNVPTTAPFTNISLDTAIFDTTYSADGNEAQGTLYWNEDELTLSLVTNGQTTELGQKVEVHVKNQTGAQINKGQVVYASGTVGSSGRITVAKMIADGTIAAKRVVGVAAENIANGADGKVVHFGKIRKVNTDSYNEGDILWVSTTTAGAFQNTEPVQADGEIALPIAIVVTKSVNNGELFVRINAIDENEYQDYDAGLQDISGLTPSDDTIIVGDGTNWVAESGDTARASLGLTIGTHVQAWDAQLDDIAGLTPTDGNFIVGNGTNFVAESGNTARTSLGLGTGDSPTFSGITSTGIIYTDNIDTVDITWNTSTQVWDATPSEYFNNPLFIGTSLDVDNDLEVDGYANIGTDLDVGGNTALLGTLSVSGNTTLGGTLTLSGSADFNSTMNLQGNLTTQANLQDDGFSEGWAGTNWKINADGSAEFEEMRIRGALRVYEFIAKQISTIGGSEILSIAQGRVSSVNVGAETITVENVTGTAGNAFKANDLWICQVVDINNDLESGGTGSIVKSVRGTVTSVSGNDIVVTIDAGDITQLEQGDLIIAYGNTSDADRQAIMYRNVDRSEDNLIMRLQTGITEFADLQDEANTRVAFGDLNGYSELNTETFGFFAGKNAEQHVLVTDSGIFFKNGSTVGAQLSSNIFKIGDNTNFLSFNTSNDSFQIKVNNFDLNTSFIQIADSINKTSSTLTSSVAYSGDLALDGLFFDEDNYFGYLTDVEAGFSNGYVFRVGEENSDFIELNSANNIFKVETDVVKINNTRSTFPSVKTSQSLSNTTNYIFTFDSGEPDDNSTVGAIEVNHIDNGIIRFYFNIDQTASGIAFLNIEVEIEGYNGSSWVALTAFDESPELIALDGYGNSGLIIKNDSPTVSATNQTTSSKVAVQYQSAEEPSHTFDGYLYLKTQTNNTFTKYRMKFSDNGNGIGYTTTLDAHGAISYKPVFEQNTAGSWVRLADAIYSVDDGLQRRTIIDDTLI